MTHRIFAVIRTAIIAPLFVAIWTWLLPRWFGGSQAFHGARPPGWIVAAAGLLMLAACAWNFAWRGLGTPAPFDPPRQLVVTGPYRYVRNPMYLGLLVTL